MKKSLLSVFTIACLAMSLTGCPSTNGTTTNPSSNPSASVSPTTSVSPNVTPSSSANGGRHFSSKADLIEYLNCLKTKVPAIAPGFEIQIKAVAALDDAKWEVLKKSYEELFSVYASYNC